VTIRAATPDDAPAVRAIYAPFVTDGATSFEAEVPDLDEVRRRIEATLATHPWLVAEDARGVLGYAYAGPHRARAAYRWAAEVSVYVAPRAHRRGVARALYTDLLDRLERQGFALALAGITLPNAPSVAFHEAMGFAPVGVFPALGFKHGAWHDVGWWSRRLRDLSPPGELTRNAF
jgi:phosphinothricin acetyltransferase